MTRAAKSRAPPPGSSSNSRGVPRPATASQGAGTLVAKPAGKPGARAAGRRARPERSDRTSAARAKLRVNKTRRGEAAPSTRRPRPQAVSADATAWDSLTDLPPDSLAADEAAYVRALVPGRQYPVTGRGWAELLVYGGFDDGLFSFDRGRTKLEFRGGGGELQFSVQNSRKLATVWLPLRHEVQSPTQSATATW